MCVLLHTLILLSLDAIAAANIEPIPVDKIKLSDYNKLRPTADVIGQNIARKLSPQEQFQHVLNLRQDLLTANKGQPTPPIVHGMDVSCMRPKNHVQCVGVYRTMPHYCNNKIPALVHYQELEVVTTPIPILEIPHAIFSTNTDFGYKSAYDSFAQQSTKPLQLHEVQILDELTTGQSSNKEWHRQRRGALTSSNFHKVIDGKQRLKTDIW